LIVASGEIAGAVLGLGCRNIARMARPVPWGRRDPIQQPVLLLPLDLGDVGFWHI
jgi:hypothetical protein